MKQKRPRADSATSLHRSTTPSRGYDLHACFLLCILASLFLHPVFQGRVLLPGDSLLLMHPWRAHGPEKFPELYTGGRFVPHNVLLDPIQQYYPWRKFATDSLRSGVIPLWNPYNFCGYPFVANGQSSVFYPLHFIFFIFGVEYGFGVSALVHLCLLGCATYGFLRQLGLREVASFVGATTFMFCGFNVVWLEYPTVSIWTMTWLPVALLCFERRLAALAGLALGLQFLAGHLQSGFYVLLCFATYATYRTCQADRFRAAPFRAAPFRAAPFLRRVAMPLAIAFAIGAIQLLPSLELIGFNPRAAGKTYESVIDSALPLRQLITLLAPNFFGNPVDGGIYWGHFNFIEMTGYPGVVSLMLAFVGLVGVQRLSRCTPRAVAWYFIALAVFSLLVATGSPAYRLLFMLPGFKQVAAVARIFVLFDFSVAVLAAMGMQFLLASEPLPQLKRIGFAAGVLAIIPIAVAVASADHWTQAWARTNSLDARYGTIYLLDSAINSCLFPTAFVVMVTALLIARGVAVQGGTLCRAALPLLVVADLLCFGIPFNPSCPRSLLEVPSSLHELREKVGDGRILSLVPQEAKTFVEVLPPNLNMLARIRSAQGSDSLYPRWYAQAFSSVLGLEVLRRSGELPNLARLAEFGVRATIGVPDRGTSPDYKVQQEQPLQESRAYVLDPEYPVRTRLKRDETNQLVISVKSDYERWCPLYVADTYFPGWVAYAKGVQLFFGRCDAMRVIRLPTGDTALVYIPTAFRGGAFVTMLTVATLLAGATARCVRQSALVDSGQGHS